MASTADGRGLGDLSAVEARLAELVGRLSEMAGDVDAQGREDVAAEVLEIQRLVETAGRRARRLLRQHRR